MKSIQTKLTVVILLIFVVAMAVLGGLNYWKARSIAIEGIEHELQAKVSNSAADIADWFEARKDELGIVAMTPEVLGGNFDTIGPFLVSVAESRKIYDSIGYIRPDGSYLNSGGSKGSLADREYFQRAIGGESVISDPVISKSTGKPIVTVALPVKSGGRNIGVIYGSIGMDNLAKKVLAIKTGKTGYAYVLQADGLAIIHPSKDIAMKVNAVTAAKLPEVLRAVNAKMIKGSSGVDLYSFDGSEKMVAYAPIPGTKWSLGVNVPMVEVTESVQALTWISLVTILVVLILAAIVIAWFARSIARPIRILEQAVNTVAAGDLSETHMGIRSNDEIGRLALSFKQMVGNVRGLIKQISSNAEHLAASSEELTASADQSSQATNQVAISIQEVAGGASEQMNAANESASIVTEMSAGIEEIAANASSVASQTEAAADKAVKGGAAVDKAVSQMSQIEATVNTSAQVVAKLGERSKEIGQIVDAISGIAGQTNLLALNAAIEAARAGEQGKGFAVVAEEVRKLAEQSEEAAKKISGLIGEIQTDTDKAVQAMQQGTQEVKTGADVVNAAGTSFREIADLVTEVSDQVKQISKAIQEMAQGSQRIVESVNKIDGLSKKSAGEAQSVSAATEEQLASMEEIATSSKALATLAQDLQTAVAKFRV